MDITSSTIIRQFGTTFHPSTRAAWGPPSLLYSENHIPLLGVKRQACGIAYSLPSSNDVKERVELYSNPPPPLCLHGLFYCEIYLYIYCHCIQVR